MNPAFGKVLQAFGFALGFWVLLGGGMYVASLVISLMWGEVPPLRLLVGTAAFLGIPLLAFRAYDRRIPRHG